MEFINDIKALIPDYGKDIRLNLDGVIARSGLPAEEALGCALAAAFAAKSGRLVAAFRGALDEANASGALAAAAVMGMTNVWYSYLDLVDDAEIKTQQAQLRMNAYGNHGGVGARKFEMWALAASLVGKCRYCIGAHVAELRTIGLGTAELKEIGRIAAVVNAAAQVLNAEAAEEALPTGG